MDGFEPQIPIAPQSKTLPRMWLIGGAVLILVIAVVVIVLVVRGRSGGADETATVLKQAEATCAGDLNPDVCKAQTLSDLAQSAGYVEACDSLSADDYDQCVWGAAREQGKPEWCNTLKNREYVTLCKDGTYLAMAKNTGDQKICEKITDEGTKSSCINIILGPVNGKNCTSRGLPEGICRIYAMIDTAVASHDASKCPVIPDDSLRFLCLDLVGSVGETEESLDTDGDGLTDAEEARYKSDPKKADTDADGFSDGEEVRNGYNPAGPGKLETAPR